MLLYCSFLLKVSNGLNMSHLLLNQMMSLVLDSVLCSSPPISLYILYISTVFRNHNKNSNCETQHLISLFCAEIRYFTNVTVYHLRGCKSAQMFSSQPFRSNSCQIIKAAEYFQYSPNIIIGLLG